MKTVRQHVLEYVISHRAVTAVELSRAFKMSTANARHHLSILTEQSLIQVIGQRPTAGKGRPSQVFGPANHASGNNLDLLASILLDHWSIKPGDIAFENPLQVLAGLLAERMLNQKMVPDQDRPAPTNLSRRLYRTTQILEQNHYQARWEAHAGAPRLLLAHCPFLAILDEHPELCSLDAFVIERLSGTAVEQMAKLTPDRAGLRFCLFRVIKERV